MGLAWECMSCQLKNISRGYTAVQSTVGNSLIFQKDSKEKMVILSFFLGALDLRLIWINTIEEVSRTSSALQSETEGERRSFFSHCKLPPSQEWIFKLPSNLSCGTFYMQPRALKRTERAAPFCVFYISSNLVNENNGLDVVNLLLTVLWTILSGLILGPTKRKPSKI